MSKLNFCPICGKKETIYIVKGDIVWNLKHGRMVREIEFEKCSNCKEEFCTFEILINSRDDAIRYHNELCGIK